MSLAINPKIDGTLELKNNDTAKTLMTFDAQGRQTNPNGLAYVGGAILVDGLSATFTNATNNINATGIGVGVEVGDVIQVSGSINNDTEFTVEVITDADNVIVNQAHAGGTTSKSLVDETATVTVKLLCKWYLAPIGLGRGDIGFTPAEKTLNVTQINSTGREMKISVLVNPASFGYIQVSDDGVNWSNASSPTISSTTNTSFCVVIPRGYMYRLFNCTMLDSGSNTNLTELR